MFVSAGRKYDERGRVKIDFDPAFHLFYKYTTAQEQARSEKYPSGA